MSNIEQERAQEEPPEIEGVVSPPLGKLDPSWGEADSVRHAVRALLYYIQAKDSGTSAANSEAGSNLSTWHKAVEGALSDNLSPQITTAAIAGAGLVGGILGIRSLKAKNLEIVAKHLLQFCETWENDKKGAMRTLDKNMQGTKGFVYDGIPKSIDITGMDRLATLELAQKHAAQQNKNKQTQRLSKASTRIKDSFLSTHSAIYTICLSREFFAVTHQRLQDAEEKFDQAIVNLSHRSMPFYYFLHDKQSIALPPEKTPTEKFYKKHIKGTALTQKIQKVSDNMNALCDDYAALRAIRFVGRPALKLSAFFTITPIRNLLNISHISQEVFVGAKAISSSSWHFRLFSNSARSHYKTKFTLPENLEKKNKKGLFTSIMEHRASIKNGICELKSVTPLYILEAIFVTSHMSAIQEAISSNKSHAAEIAISIHALLLVSEAFGYLGNQIAKTYTVLESDKAKLAAGYGEIEKYADTMNDSLDKPTPHAV